MEIKQGSFSNPDDPRRFRHYDFGPEGDTEIKVILVFVVRKLEKDDEPRLLVMRRAPKGLGAMQGLWSPIAGVDDHIPEEHGGSDEKARLATVHAELIEETGIVSSVEVHHVGSNDHAVTEPIARTWRQNLYYVRADVDTVTLNWENIGAMWVPFAEIAAWIAGDFDHPHVRFMKDEGSTFDTDGNLQRFWNWMKEHPIV